MADWVNPDVHAWSTTMQRIMSAEFPTLPAQSIEAEARADIVIAAARETTLSPKFDSIVRKIVKRRGVRDHDLCGCSPLGLFVLACEKVQDKKALNDMLADISHTCVQGDTHRLFSLLYAIHYSTIDVKN
jgi:hypothetical protein